MKFSAAAQEIPGTGTHDGGGAGAAFQSAHQRLCAVLLLKLMRRLLQSKPADLAAQLARCGTRPESQQQRCSPSDSIRLITST